jgi:hypothetical protein
MAIDMPCRYHQIIFRKPGSPCEAIHYVGAARKNCLRTNLMRRRRKRLSPPAVSLRQVLPTGMYVPAGNRLSDAHARSRVLVCLGLASNFPNASALSAVVFSTSRVNLPRTHATRHVSPREQFVLSVAGFWGSADAQLAPQPSRNPRSV